jgi:lipopolysaccharide export system protein LptC
VYDRLGAWFPLLLLASVAAFTFWLERAIQPYITPPAKAERSDPDYIVHGLSAVRMDAQGRLKHTLHAAQMTHFPHDDSTVLVNPTLVTFTQDRAPVTITSRDALMSANGENVYFENDVRVVRAAHGSASTLTLKTSYLHVIPDENVARTDRPVTIRDATTLVTANGLELNSEKRVLALQGRVKGIYHDPKPAR